MIDAMIRDLCEFLRRLSSTWFGRTLVVFIGAQVVFHVLMRATWFVELIPFGRDGLQVTQPAFMASCVYFLVAVNTIILLWQALGPYKYTGSLREDGQVTFQYRICLVVLFIACFISGFMGVSLFAFLLVGSKENPIQLGKELETWLTWSERISALIFFMFCIADYLLLKACDALLTHEGGLDKTQHEEGWEKAAEFRGEIRQVLRACDGPGFLGIVLINMVSFVIHPDVSGLYWKGFTSGAIALHMTYSQAVLAFLSVPEHDRLDDIRKTIKDGKGVLIDVRENEEWTAGHLADARHLPLATVQAGMTRDAIEALVPKEKILYVYCVDGRLAKTAANLLRKQGYDRVHPLDDGYDSLLKAGFFKAT